MKNLPILFVFLSALCQFAQAAERPHIIFIQVDDLAYTYASPWGSKTARTPTLDRLAAQGFVFDHAMCQGMMCGPSRNSLIIRPPVGTTAGKRISQPVELLDILPTSFDIAGAASEKAPNGVSLLPLFTGRGEFPRRFSFGEIENWIVVSNGRHRLLRSENGEPPLLFDDRADPENLTNIAAAHPEIVKQLGEAIDDWLKQTGARLKPN